VPGPEAEVAAFDPDVTLQPRLWKARRAFLSAVWLHGRGHLDCAANRYYYSVWHAISHFVDTERAKVSHAEAWAEFIRNHDPQAYPDINSAYTCRRRADYTGDMLSGVAVTKTLSGVLRLLKAAMARADVRRSDGP
jgi:uncharacterized protein (UPF0332 family)